MNKITLSIALLVSILVISCKKDDETKTPLVVPTTYDTTGFSANVETERNLRTQLSNFAAYIRKGDNVANKLASDSLNYYFTIGTPSLESTTVSYYTNLIENTWFANIVTASQNSFDITTTPENTVGGVYINRLLDSKGKEMLQETEKGMFAATLYNHLVALSQGTVTAATVDRMLYIYGAHGSFPNTNTAANTTTPDTYIALYTARRDRSANATGLYRQIKAEFIKLKAAVNAGSDYNQEKNEAISSIKLLVEKALLATVVNYMNSAKTKINKDMPTDAEKIGAIHDLSECVGFVHGFKGIAQSNRKITDAQINQLLTYLNAPAGGSSTMYLFATEPATTIDGLDDARDYVQEIYGFTDAEMTDFNANWISAEGR